MDVLAARTLRSTGENGDTTEIVLTVFTPFEVDTSHWKCGYIFGPPFKPTMRYGDRSDFISAFVSCLGYARARFQSYDLGRRADWQGMSDCGLPEYGEKPASWAPPDIPPPGESSGSLAVLTTRRLHGRDEGGAGTEILLTIFVPFKAEGEVWNCGITFGPHGSEPIRYGVGEDFIESLLDALAMARVVFEGRVPKGWGWSASGELQDCADLPYKIGRAFLTEPLTSRPPDEPDFSAA